VISPFNTCVFNINDLFLLTSNFWFNIELCGNIDKQAGRAKQPNSPKIVVVIAKFHPERKFEKGCRSSKEKKRKGQPPGHTDLGFRNN
jgi:hypothetical protein